MIDLTHDVRVPPDAGTTLRGRPPLAAMGITHALWAGALVLVAARQTSLPPHAQS